MTIDEKIKQAAEKFEEENYDNYSKTAVDIFKDGANIAKSLMLADMQKLVDCLDNKSDINSVRNILALMSDGEGDDPETYRTMSKGAMLKLDKALLEWKQKYQGEK